MDAKLVSALVVEDDVGLAETIRGVAREYVTRVSVATSVSAAVALVGESTPDMVLLDFVLPDGTAQDFIERAFQLEHIPRIVAITGEATPEQSFALGRAGVSAFVRKPCSLKELRGAIEKALLEPRHPIPLVRAAVGTMPFTELECGIRGAVVSEALSRTGGSIRAAAALLGISRQRLQYIIKSQSTDLGPRLSSRVGRRSGA